MDKNAFENKMADFFSKGAKASKEAFEKAGDAVQDFTDKSVTKIENKKIELKINEKYEELGKVISLELEKNSTIATFSSEIIENINKIQSEIVELKEKIK